MTIRARKLIGTIILIALTLCWLFLALVLAPLAFGSDSAIVAAAFYAVAGLGWLVFAMPLVKWMSQPDRA